MASLFWGFGVAVFFRAFKCVRVLVRLFGCVCVFFLSASRVLSLRGSDRSVFMFLHHQSLLICVSVCVLFVVCLQVFVRGQLVLGLCAWLFDLNTTTFGL